MAAPADKLDLVANKRLVYKFANRAFNSRLLPFQHQIEFDDLVSELSLTWMRCTKKFDPNLGLQFSTYFYRAATNEVERMIDVMTRNPNSFAFSSSALVNDSDDGSKDDEFDHTCQSFTPEDEVAYEMLIESVESRLDPQALVVFRNALYQEGKEIMAAMCGNLPNQKTTETNMPIMGALRLVPGNRHAKAKIREQIKVQMMRAGCQFG